jgi:hypothetical protein
MRSVPPLSSSSCACAYSVLTSVDSTSETTTSSPSPSPSVLPLLPVVSRHQELDPATPMPVASVPPLPNPPPSEQPPPFRPACGVATQPAALRRCCDRRAGSVQLGVAVTSCAAWAWGSYYERRAKRWQQCSSTTDANKRQKLARAWPRGAPSAAPKGRTRGLDLDDWIGNGN